MKRFVILLSGLAVCYSLVGCSSSEVVDDVDTLSENEQRLEEIYTELKSINNTESRINELRDILYDGNWDNDDPDLVDELEYLENYYDPTEKQDLEDEMFYLEEQIIQEEINEQEREEISPVPHLN